MTLVGAAALVFALLRPQALLAQRIPELERQDLILLLDRSASGRSATWDKLLGFYMMNRGEFLASYGKRSNVESTFSMVKRKFGDSVRSKTDAAMANEVYCKLIAHNLCVMVQEEHELGIEAIFRPTVQAIGP